MPVYYNSINDPGIYTNSTSSLGTIYLGGTKVRAGFLKPGAAMSGSGGTVYEYDGYKTHVFTTTGSNTFTINSTGSSYNQVEILIVGGGGAATPSRIYGGGGGGGGVVYIQAYPITSSGDINVFVGAGGPKGIGGINFSGSNGVTSSFADIIALGGGGGGNYLDVDNLNGINGGSGGGGSGTACPGSVSCINHGGGIGLQPTASLPAGAIGYGNNGDAASNCIVGGCASPFQSRVILEYGGGGGGVGGAASTRQSGSGLFYNWTGTNTEFGAGGDTYTFKTGSANTGKGGSSGTGYVDGGAAGGSGVVMIRYRYL